MDEFLVTEESAISFDAISDTATDLTFEDVSLDILDVSDDGGNVADLSVSAIGDNVLVDVDASAYDGGSSISGHLEAWA